jgi:hypothetical protein
MEKVNLLPRKVALLGRDAVADACGRHGAEGEPGREAVSNPGSNTLYHAQERG